MKITNISAGRLGIELTKSFFEEGFKTTLIATRSVIRGGLYEIYNLKDNANLKSIPIETTEDMYKELEEEAKRSYDLVIRSSAAEDYKSEFTFRMEDMLKNGRFN